MTEISKRMLELMNEKGLSYAELSKITGISKSGLYRYSHAENDKIPLTRLTEIAHGLNVSVPYLLGTDEERHLRPRSGSGQTIPLLGTIACGEPILAEQNFDEYVTLPDNVKADFALRCKGNSMINARIFDGDVVYIRQQPTVENGEIAAVLIDDEATLKRVHIYSDHAILAPENPEYKPLLYWGADMANMRILGKAIAFTSMIP